MSLQTVHHEEFPIVLDSLLLYVNQRFGVVRHEPSRPSAQARDGSQLIERFLWDHRDLIDDYVRDNPNNLPPEQLEMASGLADALYGTFVLVEHGDDWGTLLHHTGAYAVISPCGDPFCNLPPQPVEIRGAIAPYHGAIAIIPPFVVLGEASQGLIRQMSESLVGDDTVRPESDPQVLAQRAHEWIKEQERQKESEDELPKERRYVPEGPGPGFHQGVLSGLSDEQRAAAKSTHGDALMRASGSYDRAMEIRSLETETLPLTLQDALLLLDDDWMADIALELSDDAEHPQMQREDLARWIHRRIVTDKEHTGMALMWCLDSQFDLIDKLMTTNPYPLGQIPPTKAIELYPMIPYVFIIKCGAHLLAWMPPEVRSVLSAFDMDRVRHVRHQLDETRAAARMMSTICGILPISDLYDRYRKAAEDPLDRQHFDIALRELEVCESRDDYSIWLHEGTDYIVSVEISDASAPARVVRESYADRIVSIDGVSDQPNAPTLVGLSVEDEASFEQRIKHKEAELEEARLRLLAKTRELPAHELASPMLKCAPIDYLASLAPLRALRAFVDAHVPDDQDDYEFADLFMRSVIVSCVLMSESYNQTMDIIRLYGMESCEGTDYSDTLGRLVTNAYNALPRWNLNGWSLEENTERLTGRRRFYHEDGSVRKIGDTEPCPCGSGRPYGSCCGSLI